MARITTASLDLRLTETDAKLDLLIGTVANLALLLAGNVQEAELVQDSPATSKTPHQLMGEENERLGRMYTARYTCTTERCTNKTGFYKHESALTHAERKGHSFKVIQFAS